MKNTMIKALRSGNSGNYTEPKRKLVAHVSSINGVTSLIETARLIRTMEMLKRIIGDARDVSTDMIKSYIAEATVLKLHPMRTRTEKSSGYYNNKIFEICGSKLSEDDENKMLAEILKPAQKPQ
jgi:tetrahydromethanopterin S-methyltransferase subunit B